MEQQLVILLIKLAVAASIASILSRSTRFLNVLLREERSFYERLIISLGISLFCVAGSGIRVFTHTYVAAEFAFEGAIVAGIIGGYVAGLITGVVCALPAMLGGGEFMSMPIYAAVGVLGGLIRDLAPDPEEIWRFSPFFDLSVWRLIRYPDDRRRFAYHLLILAGILIAEFTRYLSLRLFGERMIFTLYSAQGAGVTAAVFAATVFAVTIPLKIWNSARNERLLDLKERMLSQARLAALTSQINPHFLFNTLNTVSSLIRTNPDRARQVVYKLSSILRRLLRKADNFTPLRDELAFIDDYLSIELVRFGDKLQFVKEIDPAALDCQVPAMLLQPIIENSIKHGLANKLEGGTIRLAASLGSEGKLLLRVEDDGVGIEEARLNTLLEHGGIGVSNVNERLEVLFGKDYRLSVNSRPGEGTSTEIELPAA
jgi:two-component system LytT family sensor kinase